jgi:signal transduction histidine kinase/streptogramin lyase
VVYAVNEDNKGQIWLGTGGGGAVRYADETFTFFTEKEGLSDNTVRCILKDRSGQLWFGTEGGGVNLFTGAFFSHYTEAEGLSNNFINAMLEDSQGNLWIATEYGGVSMYNPKSFTQFTVNDGLRENRTRSMLEDSQGNFWLAPWNGGVSLYREGVMKHFSGAQGFCNSPVFTMMEDSQGNLWFGTGGSGAIRYNGIHFTQYGEAEGLGSNHVRSLLEDSQGNLWVGTWGAGVIRMSEKSMTRFSDREGFTNNYVRSILEDRQGNIWFGTYGGGVSMFNGDTFTTYTEKEGLSHNVVPTILEDSQGRLWFGTYGGGVNLLEGRTITYYTEKEGLSNNIVQSLVEDRLGNIWVSTEKGLNLIVDDTLIRSYGLQEGLKGADFILNSVLADRQNRLWWGSSKSVTMLDMKSFELPRDPPEIRITGLIINDQFRDFHHLNEGDELEFSQVAEFYNYPLNPELPYKNNHLTFHFSAIDWSAPHQIRYSFRIEGLKENWSAPSPEHVADYRKLPHGSYVFMVRAIGSAHLWSETFEYPFTIHTPWWHSWWARVAYALVLLLIIQSFIRWRTVKLTKQRKNLEMQVFQATNQIREQKEEIEAQRDEVLATNRALEQQKKELKLMVENLKLTQSQLIQSEKMASVGLLTAGIAHELNNPVNFVVGSVNPLKRDLSELFTFIASFEQILEDHQQDQISGEVNELKKKLDYEFLSKEIISLLEGIEEGASRSSQIVKGLRSFSRLDKEECQLYDIHEGIDSSLILLQNKTRNRIHIRTEYGDLEEIECYPSKLNQVFLNILTNSIQAIEDRGEIFIQTIRSGIGIKIIIKDTGSGMTQEVKKQIFDPFFTTKDVGEGTGLGLSISFGIIEQHKGHIDVISEPGKGTEFIISLPLTQSD